MGKRIRESNSGLYKKHNNLSEKGGSKMKDGVQLFRD